MTKQNTLKNLIPDNHIPTDEEVAEVLGKIHLHLQPHEPRLTTDGIYAKSAAVLELIYDTRLDSDPELANQAIKYASLCWMFALEQHVGFNAFEYREAFIRKQSGVRQSAHQQ